MDRRKAGMKGEKLAARYYQEQGYEILEANYRFKRGEVDFIALSRDENLLVFVEVKNRRRKDYGNPETFVSPQQQERIHETAEEYIYAINWHKDIRFDIACVDSHEKVEVFEDAF